MVLCDANQFPRSTVAPTHVSMHVSHVNSPYKKNLDEIVFSSRRKMSLKYLSKIRQLRSKRLPFLKIAMHFERDLISDGIFQNYVSS